MGIAIRTGNHCTQPIMDKYKIPGTAIISFGIYNTKEECLIKAQWKADQMIKFIEESGSALSFNIGCEKQKVGN